MVIITKTILLKLAGVCYTFQNYVLQWTPLNGITLGRTINDPIKRMISITEYVSFSKYAIERHLGLVNWDKFDPNNRLIPLSVIP